MASCLELSRDDAQVVCAGHEPDGSPFDRNPGRWLHEFADSIYSWEWYHPNPAGHQAYAQALYDMDLLAEPPTPPALGRIDVTFVVDTSSSMAPDLDELQSNAGDIVTQLGSSTDSFKLGVVSFRDDPGTTGIGTDYLSQLDQVMTPGGTTFVNATGGLSAVGGGGDDTVYSGLVEAASKPETFPHAD